MAAPSNAHVFAPPLHVLAADAPAVAGAIPFRRCRAAIPAAGPVQTRRSSTSAPSSASTGDRSKNGSAARAPTRTLAVATRSRRARSRGAIALVVARPCTFALEGRARAAPQARSASSSSTTARRGERDSGRAPSPRHDRRHRRGPLRAASRADGRAHGRPDRPRAPANRHRPRRRDHELLVRRADRLRARAEAGRRAPGRRNPLVHAARSRGGTRSPSSTGRAWRRRTSPEPPRCCFSAIPAGRRSRCKSALVSTAGPAWADTARTRGGAGACSQGGGLVDAVAANDPKLFTTPVLALVRRPERQPRRAGEVAAPQLHDAGDGAGAWPVELRPQVRIGRRAARGAVRSRDRARRRRPRPGHRACGRKRGGGRELTASSCLRRGTITRRDSVLVAPSLGRVSSSVRAAAPLRPDTGDTRRGVSHASAYRYPAAAFGPAAELHGGPPVDESGAERCLRSACTSPS